MFTGDNGVGIGVSIGVGVLLLFFTGAPCGLTGLFCSFSVPGVSSFCSLLKEELLCYGARTVSCEL